MTIQDLQEQKAQLVAYCATKLNVGDYHAVADAAMDLRELDAQIKTLREVQETSAGAAERRARLADRVTHG